MNDHTAIYEYSSSNVISLSNTMVTLVGGELFWAEYFSCFFFSDWGEFEIDDSELRILYAEDSKCVVFILQE